MVLIKSMISELRQEIALKNFQETVKVSTAFV